MKLNQATIPRRPTIFIASSSESLDVARAIKQNFDKEADVDVWNENIFAENRSYLETLLNRASYYDFCIAVFSQDDTAIIRQKKSRVPRDNVIFEFGLFLGRIGINRTFFVIEDGATLFSDWEGISKISFRRRDNLISAVGTSCDKIRAQMATAEKLTAFSMLPSTSLAIGYYSNFLKNVFHALDASREVLVTEPGANGKPQKEYRFMVKDRYPTVHVKLPRQLSDLEPENLRRHLESFIRITVQTAQRPFPFYISGKLSKRSQRLTLFDIPTTMLSSKIAIDSIFTPEFLARDETRKKLEQKEISNFERTLRILVPDKIEKRFFKFSLLEE